ncbi:MAG: BACON domain-containing carbohydrate-binding protein, partial [Reichenbachiella sp.]
GQVLPNNIEFPILKWHLSRVVDYSTQEEITFSYRALSSDAYTEYNHLNSRYYKENTSVLETVNQQILKVKRLPFLVSEISHKNTTIRFNYGEREDDYRAPKNKLESVEYLIGDQVKVAYNFNYGYMGSGQAARLTLRNVSKSGLDVLLYQFLYYGDAEGEPILPWHKSTKQDHWGFHNANSSGTLYEIMGAERNPSLTHAQANTLKSIYYTSGGYDEFEYELNTYMKNDVETEAGGLRIKNVYKNDGAGTRYLVKSYDYTEQVNGQSISSGKLFTEPVYSKSFTSKIYFEEKVLDDHREYAILPLADAMGRHICYGEVTTTDIDDGQITTKFHVFEDDQSKFGTGSLDLSGHKWYYKTNDLYDLSPRAINGSLPFGSKSFNGSFVGYPRKIEIFDQRGKQLNSQDFEYTLNKNTDYTRGFTSLMTGYYTNNSVSEKSYKTYSWGFYTLSLGYPQLEKKTTTIYDAEDITKSLTTVTEYSYHADHPLPIKTITYRSDEKNNARVQETSYLFESDSRAYYANLLTLPKTRTSKSSDEETGTALTTLSTGVTEYGTNALGKLVPVATKQYTGTATADLLVNDVSYLYDVGTGRAVGSKNNMTGLLTVTIPDDNGQYSLASVVDAEYAECAYTSFEGHDSGRWSYEGTASTPQCDQRYQDCLADNNDCIEEENDPPSQECLEACRQTKYECVAATQKSAYQVAGLFGNYAFDLNNGRITSPTIQGSKEFRLSYWYKDGTVSISSLSGNTLLASRTLDGWTYEEREISRASDGVIYITGSASIDELKLYPSGAEMTTSIVDPIFGTASETDVNNNTIFYTYDAAGRLSMIRDQNLDVITAKQYHIAPFFNILTTSANFSYAAEDQRIAVVSNERWSVSVDGNPGWISLSENTGTFNCDVIISTAVNNGTSTRSATVRFTSASGQIRTLAVNQGFYKGSFSVSPRSLSFTETQETHTVEVLSNTGWTVTSDNISPLYFSETEGLGNGNFDVTLEARYVGQGLITITFDDGSDLTIFVNANAPEGDE